MSLAASPSSVSPVAAADSILTINNIEVVYDHVILVLKGVSLNVPRGGIVALLGANGAGKTTTLKAISNLLHAERGEVTKGSIIFDGTEVHARSPSKAIEPFVTSPRSAWRRLEIALSVVVLPAPLAPSSAVMPPAGTDSDTPFSTRMTWL